MWDVGFNQSVYEFIELGLWPVYETYLAFLAEVMNKISYRFLFIKHALWVACLYMGGNQALPAPGFVFLITP